MHSSSGEKPGPQRAIVGYPWRCLSIGEFTYAMVPYSLPLRFDTGCYRLHRPLLAVDRRHDGQLRGRRGVTAPLVARGAISDAMVEACAKALYDADPCCFDNHRPFAPTPWDKLREFHKERFRMLATTAYAALAPALAQQTITDERLGAACLAFYGAEWSFVEAEQMRAVLEIVAPAQDWRPIDDEARNGAKVIGGYHNLLGNWRTVVARYYKAKTLDAAEYLETEDGYAPEGWYEESETHDDILPIELTHYLPLAALPSPPLAETK